MKDYWERVIDGEEIIVNGICYHDGGVGKPVCGSLGYDGKWFNIRKKDGTIIKTNNLWYNGKVPEELGLEDNAEFID